MIVIRASVFNEKKNKQKHFHLKSDARENLGTSRH